MPHDLITISSRCARIDFRAIGADVIAARLLTEGINPAGAMVASKAALGNLDRARVLATDPDLADRRKAFIEAPEQLDGTGAVAMRLAARLLELIDAAAKPLAERHAIEVEVLDARIKEHGERGSGKKQLEERHKRELRRHRTDELRSGLATLAATYRDQAVSAVDDRKHSRRHRWLRRSGRANPHRARIVRTQPERTAAPRIPALVPAQRLECTMSHNTLRLPRVLIVLIAMIGLGAFATTAFAHSGLGAASPAPGSRVGGTITEIQLRYSSTVADVDGSVTDPDGNIVESEWVQDGNLRVTVMLAEPLSTPGQYAVRHISTDVEDNDRVEAAYLFTYDPAAPPPQLEIIPEDEGFPWIWVLIGTGGVVIVLLAWQLYRSMRRSRQSQAAT